MQPATFTGYSIVLRRVQGFTLIELILVSGLSGFLLTAWIGSLTYHLVSLDNRLQTARKTQQFNQIGVWLSQELERARDNGEYAWSFHDGCLLYSEDSGVRVQNGLLQWRGGERPCYSPSWVSLSDRADFSITSFSVAHTGEEQGYLSLSADIEGETVSWEYRFNGKLLLNP